MCPSLKSAVFTYKLPETRDDASWLGCSIASHFPIIFRLQPPPDPTRSKALPCGRHVAFPQRTGAANGAASEPGAAPSSPASVRPPVRPSRPVPTGCLRQRRGAARSERGSRRRRSASRRQRGGTAPDCRPDGRTPGWEGGGEGGNYGSSAGTQPRRADPQPAAAAAGREPAPLCAEREGEGGRGARRRPRAACVCPRPSALQEREERAASGNDRPRGRRAPDRTGRQRQRTGRPKSLAGHRISHAIQTDRLTHSITHLAHRSLETNEYEGQ